MPLQHDCARKCGSRGELHIACGALIDLCADEKGAAKGSLHKLVAPCFDGAVSLWRASLQPWLQPHAASSTS